MTKKLSENNPRISKVRISLVREPGDLGFGRVRLPEDAARVARRFVPEDIDREMFFVLMLDTRNNVTAANLVSIGTLNGGLVHPREVFKAAILENAAAVVLGHNHPSGDVTPSAEDRALTMRLVNAGNILGIGVLDHLIIGHGANYYSFKEKGLI